MDRGVWWATVHGGQKESDMTEQLTFSLFFFMFLYQKEQGCCTFIVQGIFEESSRVWRSHLGEGRLEALEGFRTLGKNSSSMIHLHLSARSLCTHISPVSFSQAQSCLILRDPMDCSPPGSSVYRVFQASNTEVSSHFLLQGIFLTQKLNTCLLRLLHW